MPHHVRGAQWASHLRSARLAHIVLAAFLAALALPVVMPATPAAAAVCGTNWKSHTTPPPSVRVLVTRKGTVDVVPFREYVAKVLASGEFPSYDPLAVVEAGATAVKQYAWYYALKGHHRSSYVTRDGTCYDVRDDTVDQLYRSFAKPTPKQLRAVDATWGLTIHKFGRFILTGYRYGANVRCGADADGWRLYERSMINCAKAGWSRQRIQDRYYRPNVQFVWHATGAGGSGDLTPPTVSVPRVVLSGQVGRHKVGVTVSWSGSDAASGLAGFALQVRVGGGAWRSVHLGSATATSFRRVVLTNHTVQFRVRARDKAGNRTAWVSGPTMIPRIIQGSRVVLHGTWAETPDAAALAGSIQFSSAAGSEARLAFSGRAIGVVAQRGPGAGQARVFLDRRLVATIDLASATLQERQVVWTHAWKRRASHTIAIQVVGTAGRPIVGVDAFELLH